MNCPMAIKYVHGFPAENDALKIGKHNGGQVIHSADETFRLRKWPVMGQKPSRSCAMYCRVSVAACTALPAHA
ncbi:hypothetical protein ACLB1Q_09135 [Escherichia coli]